MRGLTLQRENALKTQCPQGHEYTLENTYRHRDGRRVCKTCRRASDNRDGPRERRKLYKRQLRAALRNDREHAA
jgi:transposase-like protein